MRKFFIIFVLLCALIIQTAAPVTIYAAEVSPSDEILSDSEKTEIAGWVLTDIMDLILDQYVGEAVTPEDLYEAAIRGMTGILDTYSVYMDDDELTDFTGSLSGKLTGIGVMLRTNNDGKPEILRVLPDTPAKDAGLRKGDIILSVNGVSVVEKTVSEIVDMITDSAVRRVALKVERGKTQVSVNMWKREIKSVTVFTDRLENILTLSDANKKSAYRYVAITSISDTTADDLKKALSTFKKENVKGIVLDMRGNSGGYLDVATDICNQIVPSGPIYHTVDSKGNKQTVNSTLSEKPFEQIVVLVDRDTASAAELISSALQDSEAAVIIGETTFGKGVIQTMFPLSTGGALKMTTEEYLRRSGETINKIGVIPDIAVEMNPSDYETPNDTALIRALEWLTQQ